MCQQDKIRSEGVTHNDCSLDSLPSKSLSRKIGQLTHRKQMIKFKSRFVGKKEQERTRGFALVSPRRVVYLPSLITGTQVSRG